MAFRYTMSLPDINDSTMTWTIQLQIRQQTIYMEQNRTGEGRDLGDQVAWVKASKTDGIDRDGLD